MTSRDYDLTPTTQGPLYPPSEIMNADGDFVVVGRTPLNDGSVPWAGALVRNDTPTPPFGKVAPYAVRDWIGEPLSPEHAAMELYTLPLPLPANNYPMLFAPQQCPDAHDHRAPSFPLHAVPIPDLEPLHGRRRIEPITLGDWLQARGRLSVSLADDGRTAEFAFTFSGLLPESLYTVMALRIRDLDPDGPTRPGPLGVPNVFMTDRQGAASYRVDMPDPFPASDRPDGNRIVNVVVLWMSRQTAHGGAIGLYGLGGDIHAQLKLSEPSFQEFTTKA